MSEESNQQYVISQENWTLHRKGYDDQQRHQEKVQEAIKNNLPGSNFRRKHRNVQWPGCHQDPHSLLG